jgi:hypothetical protein
MQRALLMVTMLASLALATWAREIRVDYPAETVKPQLTLTGQIGSYKDPGEDGFEIITTPPPGDVVITPQGKRVPVGRIVIWEAPPALKMLSGKQAR